MKITAESLLRTLVFGLSLGVLASAPAAVNMKAFPPAEKGMVRHVLQLPKQDDESAFKVELLVGQTVQVDEGNRYFFGGKIEVETIEGWDFHATMSASWGRWLARGWQSIRTRRK